MVGLWWLMEVSGYHKGLYDDMMGGMSYWLKRGYWTTGKYSLKDWILDGSVWIRTLDSWICYLSRVARGGLRPIIWLVRTLNSWICCLSRVARGGLRPMIWLVRTLDSWIWCLWRVARKGLRPMIWLVRTLDSWICYLSRVARGVLRPMIWFCLDVTS